MKNWTRPSFNQSLTALGVWVSRLGFLPANVSPVGSFGFFGHPGLFFLVILLFDLLVGGVYKDMLFTYAGFAAYPILGWVARHRRRDQLMLLPVASFLFFLLSNLGSFLYWYPQTWSGLVACYAAALPFYTRTLVGDLFFGYGYVALKAVLTRQTQVEREAVVIPR